MKCGRAMTACNDQNQDSVHVSPNAILSRTKKQEPASSPQKVLPAFTPSGMVTTEFCGATAAAFTPTTPLYRTSRWGFITAKSYVPVENMGEKERKW